MRCRRRPWSATSRSSRSKLSARWLPRLSRQTAWISSMIDGLGVREHRTSRHRGEQEVERLGRRHEQVRRVLAQRGALGGRRVAGAQPDAQRRALEPELACGRGRCPRAAASRFSVTSAASARSGRDVDDARTTERRLTGVVRAPGRVDRDEEAGEGLARAGGRRDEHVAARRDGGPGAPLRLGGPVGEARRRTMPRRRGGTPRADPTPTVRGPVRSDCWRSWTTRPFQQSAVSWVLAVTPLLQLERSRRIAQVTITTHSTPKATRKIVNRTAKADASTTWTLRANPGAGGLSHALARLPR